MPAGLVRQTASQSQSYRSVQHNSHSVALGTLLRLWPVLDAKQEPRSENFGGKQNRVFAAYKLGNAFILALSFLV